MLQEISFTVDLFVLAIEGPDVVLGFPWLHLVVGTQPVNVRPYRYLYYQKVKMEKLVRDMMQ